MNLPNLLAPTYSQMLGALSQWLDKASAASGDAPDAIMAARLADDMFPLSTQVRFACVQAREGMARLNGEAFPEEITVLLDEGRGAGENPGSIADAQARIAQTRAFLEGCDAGEGDAGADPERPVAHERPNGMVFDLTMEQYARDWALPQFYFHLMTAYAILRAQGVDLGKADYVQHMFAYLRPGTMPG